jgi:hypothetical protein
MSQNMNLDVCLQHLISEHGPERPTFAGSVVIFLSNDAQKPAAK